MTTPKRSDIIVIASDSPLVQAILDADSLRKKLVQSQERPPNSADTCQSDPVQIASIANVAFWASIAVEERRPVRGVLCVACPDEVPSALMLSSPQPVSIESVVALTTAAPSSALAVHTGPSGSPEVWGIVDPHLLHFLHLRIAGPGIVIASINKSVVALMHDGRISIPQQASAFSFMSILSATFGAELPFPDRLVKATWLLKIAASMFRHGHGGILVVAPSSDDWRSHVDIKYQFADSQGSNLLKQRLVEMETATREAEELQMALVLGQPTDLPNSLIPLKLQAAEAHKRLVMGTLHQIGGLTAVDGAVVIGEDFSLLGFGAKLQPPPGNFDLALVDALDGSLREHAGLSEVGGTRHQSAACFVKHHNDALAFVASQDGHLTLFAWAIKEATVVGLRNLHHMIWEY